MSTKKLEVKINQEIISILGKKLYSSQYAYVVLRELIQNSLDANCQELRITWNANEGILRVEDDGIGISHIEGLLDTIGGSEKTGLNNSIGGYGLAKLAIFGTESWKFTSISGSFSTGFIFDEDEKIENGTIVTCQFNLNDISSNTGYWNKEYLKFIDRKNVKIFYNGELIQPYEFTLENFGNNQEKFSVNSSCWNGRGIIRVNGLMSFSNYISNLTGIIIFDYSVSCKPYEDGYPLTSNRDDFIDGTKEKIDLENRIKEIEKKLETDKKLSENVNTDKESSLKWRNKEYLTDGEVKKSDFEEYAKEISTYERYLKQIALIEGFTSESENFQIGLANVNNYEGANQGNRFFLQMIHMNKGKILAIAIHEFTHFLGYGQSGHDQEFASKMTKISGHILDSILDGEFRK